jgi:hypothetical protein
VTASRRPLIVAGRDAPWTRAASLASSAARAVQPISLWPRPSTLPEEFCTNPYAPHWRTLSRPSRGVSSGHTPSWGQSAARTTADRPPSGGVERPRRVVRFARLIHRRGRAFWRTCGPRRLRRQSQPDLNATHGGAVGAPCWWSDARQLRDEPARAAALRATVRSEGRDADHRHDRLWPEGAVVKE